jgi:hypothetical protein
MPDALVHCCSWLSAASAAVVVVLLVLLLLHALLPHQH